MRMEIGLIMGVVLHHTQIKTLKVLHPPFFESRMEMNNKIYTITGVCSVFINNINSITIKDEKDGDMIIIDECCAEKLCDLIMRCATAIRSKNDE